MEWRDNNMDKKSRNWKVWLNPKRQIDLYSNFWITSHIINNTSIKYDFIPFLLLFSSPSFRLLHRYSFASCPPHCNPLPTSISASSPTNLPNLNYRLHIVLILHFPMIPLPSLHPFLLHRFLHFLLIWYFESACFSAYLNHINLAHRIFAYLSFYHFATWVRDGFLCCI